MRKICRILLLAIGIVALFAATAVHANYASVCAGCHAASGTPEVDNLPNSVGLSGSIRAANNLAYLNTKIGNGMGGSATSNLDQTARQAIVSEIGSSASVSAPVFTSSNPHDGPVNSFYTHTFTANAAPTLVGNAGLATPFTITGSLPPGVSLDGASGVLSGTPTAGGSFSGSVRANNLIGAGTTQTYNFTITKFTQTVNFGAAPSPAYSPGGTFSVVVSATSGLSAFTFSASGNCTVANQNVNSITTTAPGSCNVTVIQPGNGIYYQAQNTQIVTIAKGVQTISFGAQSPATRTYAPGLSFALNPAATGGPLVGAITYATSNSQICTVSGTTVNVGPLAGTCSITATQNGNTNYNSISATQNIAITATVPTAPVISLAAPGNGLATVAFALPTTDGGSPITNYRATCNPGNFFTNGGGSPLVVSGLSNGSIYTCTVTATNAVGSVTSAPASVTPTNGTIPPGVSSANNLSVVVGTATSLTVTATGNPAPSLTMSGTLPNGMTFVPATGVLSGTPPLGTVGTYPLVFGASNGVLPNASQNFTLTVMKAAQSITFNAISGQTLNNAQVPLSATSSAGLPITFTSQTTGTCTISGFSVVKVAAGTCNIAANQSGNANYLAAAQVVQSFVITANTVSTTQGQNDWSAGGGFLQFNACSGCHSVPPSGHQLNAANAPGIIAYIYANTIFSSLHNPGPFPLPPNSQQQAELAYYIGTQTPGTNPVNRAVAFSGGTSFTIPNITLGTGTLTTLSVVSPPVKGTVTITGVVATYTPFPGQTGADAFTYHATGPAGSTDTRTATILISNPAAPVISSASTAMATVGFSFSYFIGATNGPTSFGATGLPAGLAINTNTGQIYGTPTTIGTYPVTISASNAGGMGTLPLSLTVSGIQLTVSKAGTASGTVSSSPAGISNCSTTCSAGFVPGSQVTLTATPGPGAGFTGWSGGSCTGNGTCTLTMDIAKLAIATFDPPTAPSVPTNVNASGGDGLIAINFTNPLNNGGLPIVNYPITCNPGALTQNAVTSPAIFSGLANGVTYTCDVRANNGVLTGPAATVSATTQPSLALTHVYSRKIHGAAGAFDFELAQDAKENGSNNVEARAIGSGFLIVFTFNRPIVKESPPFLAATGSTPAVGSVSSAIAGNSVIVTVTGVPDQSTYQVGLKDVDGQTGVNVSAYIAFIQGDVNANRAVNASDISAVKANIGNTAKESRFMFDINADGSITQADVNMVKARSGSALP